MTMQMYPSEQKKSPSVEATLFVVRDMLYEHLSKGYGSIKFEVKFHQGVVSSVNIVEETILKIGS